MNRKHIVALIGGIFVVGCVRGISRGRYPIAPWRSKRNQRSFREAYGPHMAQGTDGLWRFKDEQSFRAHPATPATMSDIAAT